MRVTFSSLVSSLTLAIALLAMPGSSSADEPAAPQSPEAALQALAEASKPGPEHRKLAPLAGKWTFTCKMYMDPTQPPSESTGKIERKWILGNRFLEEQITGVGPDGSTPFEGRGTIGYDKQAGTYSYNWLSSMSTAVSNGIGSTDDAGKHFTFKAEVYCPIQGEKVVMRDEIVIESNDRHTLTSYQVIDGKDVKMMELTVVRQK